MTQESLDIRRNVLI